MRRENKGSPFDDWLKEEGIHEEVSAAAIKRVLARQIERARKEKQLSKAEVARRMHTSRAALDRLLDPQNGSVTLNTLYKAAAAVGRQVRLELVRSQVVNIELVAGARFWCHGLLSVTHDTIPTNGRGED